MSTWIGHGYKLERGLSVTDFARQLDALFTDARYKAIMRGIAELVVELQDTENKESERLRVLQWITHDQVNFDRIRLGDNRAYNSIAVDTLYALNSALRADIAYRVPSLDINLTIRFFADPSDPEQQYATIHTENSEYVEIWNELECVEEFFYWNHKEEPKTSTRKEWLERGKKWDEVIGDTTLGINSVRWDLSTFPIRLITVDDVELESYIADVRLQKAANEEWARSLWGENLERLMPGFKEDDDNGDDTSELVPR